MPTGDPYPSVYGLLSSAIGNGIEGTVNSQQGYWGTQQAQMQQGIQQYQYQSATTNAVPNYGSGWTVNPFIGIQKLVHKFFRINKEIQFTEGALFEEPLDELRLKVAKWLNKEKK